MNNRSRAVAVLLAGLAIAASCLAEGATAAADRQMADGSVAWMARVLQVPTTPDIDPPLRDAMAGLVREHVERLRTLVPAWIAEERARQGVGLKPGTLDRAIHNRVVNELALWRLESPGADYDAALARALLRPGICDRPPRDNYMGTLMTWFQAVPAADRPVLLAGERTLLAHWGTHRDALAPPPERSLSEEAADEIARLRSGRTVPDVAMPPLLADAAFKGQLAHDGSDVECALQQWGLARALHRGDPPTAALVSWRYATMKTAEDWSQRLPGADKNADPAAYPPVASMWEVTGWVEVRVTLDAGGRFASARVTGRQLVVPGVTDNPPVAFETLLDAASIAGAPRQFKPVVPPADGSAPKPVALRLNWKLQ